MRNYSRFKKLLHKTIHQLGSPDYVVLRTGDGHWMAIAGPVLILHTGRIIRPHKDTIEKLWCVIEDVRYRHPQFSWDFMDVISQYVGGRWVNFKWYTE